MSKFEQDNPVQIFWSILNSNSFLDIQDNE